MADTLTRYESATNTSITVGATTTTVLAAGGGRQVVVLTNDSDEAIYLGIGGAAVMNKGIRLNASGGAYEINGTNAGTAVINAICASGSKNLCVMYA